MKQTPDEMILAIEAFKTDKKVEISSDGVQWNVTEVPIWDFRTSMYRPVKVPIVTKYLCYEDDTGELTWFREGSVDEEYFSSREDFTSVPELDKEVTR